MQPHVNSPATNTSTVFVVDDDDSLRDAIRSLLRSVGHTVEMYQSAEEFLEHRNPAQPGCLVLDIRLPDGNGIEVMRTLRRRGWRGRAILITAFADTFMAADARASGFAVVLEKPLHHHALVAALAP